MILERVQHSPSGPETSSRVSCYGQELRLRQLFFFFLSDIQLNFGSREQIAVDKTSFEWSHVTWKCKCWHMAQSANFLLLAPRLVWRSWAEWKKVDMLTAYSSGSLFTTTTTTLPAFRLSNPEGLPPPHEIPEVRDWANIYTCERSLANIQPRRQTPGPGLTMSVLVRGLPLCFSTGLKALTATLDSTSETAREWLVQSRRELVSASVGKLGTLRERFQEAVYRSRGVCVIATLCFHYKQTDRFLIGCQRVTHGKKKYRQCVFSPLRRSSLSFIQN